MESVQWLPRETASTATGQSQKQEVTQIEILAALPPAWDLLNVGLSPDSIT